LFLGVNFVVFPLITRVIWSARFGFGLGGFRRKDECVIVRVRCQTADRYFYFPIALSKFAGIDPTPTGLRDVGRRSCLTLQHMDLGHADSEDGLNHLCPASMRTAGFLGGDSMPAQAK